MRYRILDDGICLVSDSREIQAILDTLARANDNKQVDECDQDIIEQVLEDLDNALIANEETE